MSFNDSFIMKISFIKDNLNIHLPHILSLNATNIPTHNIFDQLFTIAHKDVLAFSVSFRGTGLPSTTNGLLDFNVIKEH